MREQVAAECAAAEPPEVQVGAVARCAPPQLGGHRLLLGMCDQNQKHAEAGAPVAAVGLITEPQQAEKIVTDSEADAVLLGRELLRDPSFARHTARVLGGDVHVPEQYLHSL